MALIERTPENQPYFDALLRLVAGVPDDNAIDKLTEGIQELMAARERLAALGGFARQVADFPLKEHREVREYCRICEAEPERRRGETGWTVHHEPHCLVTRARALLEEGE